MGIGVVAPGAHRHEVGDLVLAPRGVADAGALARRFRTRVHPAAVDAHDREPGDDRRLGLRLLGPERVDPLISRLPQLLADFVGDPSHLPAADLNFGLIGERFRGGVERSASGGGADDLTKNRRRKAVRVEPQARAEREKNPGGRPGNDRRVHRTRSSRREPERSSAP